LVEVKRLTVQYPGGRSGPVTANNDVSIEIMPGETLGLVGESGSGKSTLGDAILGFAPVRSGEIWFQGTDITRLDGARRRALTREIQPIFQNPFGSLNPVRTVGATLREGLVAHRLATPRQADQKTAEWLEVVGLGADAAGRYPADFSGGQRQRIAIARALILEPKLVICDEAVSALDLSIQAQVLNLLIELKDRAELSYLFISHDMAVVEHMSDRIVVMRNGQIVEQGPAAQVVNSPKQAYTRALLEAVPLPDPVLQKARRAVRRGEAPVSTPTAAPVADAAPEAPASDAAGPGSAAGTPGAPSGARGAQTAKPPGSVGHAAASAPQLTSGPLPDSATEADPARAEDLPPEIRAWFRRIKGCDIETVRVPAGPGDAPAARQAARRLSDLMFREFGRPAPKGVEARLHWVPSSGGGEPVRVREYRPAVFPLEVEAAAEPAVVSGASSANGSGEPRDQRLAAYVMLHGGGFWLGSIDDLSDLSNAAERAAGTGVAVFDVDYRLGPEACFPAGLEDCYTALSWVFEQADSVGVDSNRIAVGGVSAGAGLAAALCHLARQRGGPPICGQLLEVPAVDLRPGASWDDRYAPINGLANVEEMLSIYLPAGADPADPLVSPLAAADLTGLPPAHIMTAEVDPLRPGGEAYALALRRAGVPVTATRHLGAVHGSNGLAGTWSGARLWEAEAQAALRELTKPR
jgi:peptide/nickel transport system ATP-binding protein